MTRNRLSRGLIEAGERDLVILDEINLALAHGLIPLKEALSLLGRRPPWVEVVLPAAGRLRNCWTWRIWSPKCAR